MLSNRYPASFERLARDVPAYLADGSVAKERPSPTVKRMFERDKKELREFGVPIETLGEEGEAESTYRLRTTDFYLPYLSLVTPGRTANTRRHKTDRYGYRSLPSVIFEPDELMAMQDATSRARELGDPTLAAAAESAMRKLAFDLSFETGSASSHEHLVPPRRAADPATLAAVSDALMRHKRVTFVYESMNSRRVSERNVEPYGLFFLSGHWYLAARNASDGPVKNFRVSRMRDVAVNARRAGSPDYDIPRSFNLREHGRARHAWELGGSEGTDAVVEFCGTSGAAVAGAELGTVVEGARGQRRFRVRRMDTFSRWILSFAGEAVPVSPPQLVRLYRKQIRATYALYDTHLPDSDVRG
jgi:predicted DNA-binding transcriptional regulator YafY